MTIFPDLQEIETTAAQLANHIIHTPTLPYYGQAIQPVLDESGIRLWLKLELLQKTGSFKARGAMNVLSHLTDEQRALGVTAFSAGNHAIATAYAAQTLGVSATVAMPKTANPYRVQRCQQLGAQIVFGDTIGELLSITQALQNEEGRALVHPFEGQHTFAGTATVGLEMMQDAPELDAIVIPIGGGGLIAGIAAAVKQINRRCSVYGVEPDGAQGMTQSLNAGHPLSSVTVNTIADSLGAPMHAQQSFEIIKKFVDRVVTVSDSQLAETMRLIFTDLKLAVEPACAAALAAVLHPLKDTLAGKNVGVLLCGSNIDQLTYTSMVKR